MSWGLVHMQVLGLNLLLSIPTFVAGYAAAEFHPGWLVAALAWVWVAPMAADLLEAIVMDEDEEEGEDE